MGTSERLGGDLLIDCPVQGRVDTGEEKMFANNGSPVILEYQANARGTIASDKPALVIEATPDASGHAQPSLARGSGGGFLSKAASKLEARLESNRCVRD